MKAILSVLGVALLSAVLTTGSIVALSPKERAIAVHAQTELRAAMAQRDLTKGELDLAKQAALDSAKSAALTESRAITAESQAITEHNELVRSARENASMRVVIDRVNSGWGWGAITYGVARLVKHLLILIAVIAGIVAALFIASFFFPVIGVALRAIGPLLGRFFALFKRKKV